MHLSDMLIVPDGTEPSGGKEAQWIWKLKVQNRVKFFLWKLVWCRLQCKVVLARRGIISMADQCCDVCPQVEEDCDRVILCCSFARSY